MDPRKIVLTPAILPADFAARCLLALLLLAAAFFIGLLVPVLASLIIIGFASWPLYQCLLDLCRGRTTLAASVATLFVTLGLIIPVIAALVFAAEELRVWVRWLIAANQRGLPAPDWVGNLPVGGVWLRDQWDQYLAEPGAFSDIVNLVNGQQLGNISRWLLTLTGGALNFLLAMLFMLISLFFVYKDGRHFARQLDVVGERILPNRWQQFSRVVPATVSATVMGMTLVAIWRERQHASQSDHNESCATNISG